MERSLRREHRVAERKRRGMETFLRNEWIGDLYKCRSIRLMKVSGSSIFKPHTFHEAFWSERKYACPSWHGATSVAHEHRAECACPFFRGRNLLAHCIRRTFCFTTSPLHSSFLSTLPLFSTSKLCRRGLSASGASIV